jgi:hypothetical protein
MHEPVPLSQLEQIASVLLRHGVEFIVIGGQAETLFGSPRVTFDFNFCYRRSPANYAALAAALREMKVWLRGAPKELPFVIDARSIELGSNFTFASEMGDVDFLGFVEPIGDFESLLAHAETHDLAIGPIRTISLDDLIRVKQHIKRAKDGESLMQLLAIKRIREAGKA